MWQNGEERAVQQAQETAPPGFWARARALAEWMEEQDGEAAE